MARRRGAPDAYTFDLVPGDEVGRVLPDAAVGDEPSLARRTLARVRTATPRQRAVAGGVALGVLLVAGGGIAVAQAVQEHRVAERLRAAPGGVIDLSGALGETWSVSLDGRYGGEAVLSVLAGGAILVPSGDDAVAAVDVVDGSERWRVELGADPDCGPQPRPYAPAEWSTPSESVVCLAGPADVREVTVLEAADGTVLGTRTLGPEHAAPGAVVEPGAGGTLVVLRRPGPLPEGREVPSERIEELWEELETVWPEGQEAVLTFEDAVSGVVLSEIEAPAGSAVPLWECATGGTDDGVRATVEFGLGEVVASPAVVVYGHCGIHVAATADGVELTGASLTELVARGWFDSTEVLPYPGGGFLTNDGVGQSRLLDATGETVMDVRGSIMAPLATDGTADDVVLVDEYGSHLRAVDRDGAELWEIDTAALAVVARAGGVVVLGGFGQLTGVDLASGAELWSVGREDLEAAGAMTGEVTGAVTDGTALLVSAMAGGGSGGERTGVFGVDLLTGTLFAVDVETVGWGTLVAVDGRALLQAFALGSDDGGGGGWVATVRGLGR